MKSVKSSKYCIYQNKLQKSEVYGSLIKSFWTCGLNHFFKKLYEHFFFLSKWTFDTTMDTTFINSKNSKRILKILRHVN